MRRAAAAFVAVAVLAGIAWAVAERTESPEQAEARAAPPEPIPVVARLESGQLEPPVSVTAKSGREQSFDVSRRPNGEVVTATLVRPGDIIGPGAALLRANGRPLFALPGAFPFYRDLGGGDVGDDVAQLQAGLQAAGYSTAPDPQGEFRSGTKSAIASLYETVGIAPPNDDDALRQQISSLEQQIAGAPEDRGLRTARADAIGRLGPRAVAAELATVPVLPASVESIAPVGTALVDGTAIATLGAGEVVLTATVPSSVASAISEGATGTFETPDRARNKATVRHVDPGETADESTITFGIDNPVAVGLDLVVQVANPAAETGDQLLAPVASIIARGGRSYVYRHDDGAFVEVEVEVLGSIGGVAAIEPTSPDTVLTAGTEVRIGNR